MNGLMSIIVEALNSGVMENACIVPISISYDKLIENSFVSELLGLTRKREGILCILGRLFSYLFGFIGKNKCCGDVILTFGTPKLLKVI